MTSEPTVEADITPQEPGATPTVDTAKLEAILAKAQNKIPAELDGLGAEELGMLRTLELQGKGRAVVLKAIDTVLGSLEADEGLGEEIQGNSEANLGDRERYARMRAQDVDRSKILVPVLTLDGWVLPLNRATEG